MGFSSSLQGQSSHESLLLRQDAEVRLLENMRRCLNLRVKADRDYALALQGFVMQSGGNAAAAPNEVMSGSQVAKAWAAFVEESEKMAKYVKEGAEFLAGTVLEKLNELYSEKKANRKQYQEESQRIAAELRQLQDSVNKTRVEYERCLETYSASKAKYEDHCGRGKNGGKRFEDSRERYHKACRKLHLTHNEYVLLLCEASEFERDMRTILLPGLLEHQQAIQEDMVEKWKIVLQEVQRSCNLADRRYQDLQERVEAAVAAVRSSEEYTRFIELHRTPPPPALLFKFDPVLVSSGSQLNPNGVVLDELTIESLKQRLAENEAKLHECRAHIQDKQTQIIQFETELSTVKFKSDQISISRMFSIKKVADVLKKEVNELRCREQKLTRQNELIQGPLNELGCEQAPPGFLDLSPQQEDGGGGDISSFPSSGSLSRGRILSSGQVMSMLKKPFTGSRKLGSQQSLGGSRPDFTQEFDASEEVTVTAAVNSNMDDEEGRLEIKIPPPKLPPPPVPTDPLSTLLACEHGRPLEEELWFHGVLPRGEVVRLLEMDGDFLVRETTRNDERQIVLSVMWTSPKHFIVQTSPEGLFRFEGPAFPTVQELILHQFRSESAVTSRSGAILKTPVLREKWELNNDDVELMEKLGRGNFGDVYRAKLRPGNVPVAVKTCKTTLPEEQKKKFLQEGRILKQYDHPNVVRFIGICVQKQPIMIVMELVPGGSLLNYLRNNGAQLTQKNLLGMCLDAAAGMQYLESKNCIHRDLAARNCLVGEANGVKISDFGMSREEEEYTVSDGLKQIPIKWTAPEALNYGKYTSLCDVWSFGVLCWEIFSRGGTPYQGMTNTRAREMLDSGYRMPSPDGTPEEMYQLMLRCWQYDPEDRPHFPEIRGQVDMFHSRFNRRSVTFEKSPLTPGGSSRSASRLSSGSESSNWFMSTLRRHFKRNP